MLKFSGGRSSAALAFLLAESGLLRPTRGDVILFANTSAEHPATYDFARECKEQLEGDFGLPFLWFEFCTVEDARRGVYVRRPSYRLVTSNPVESDPRGYRSRGEVFEEMLSYQGMLPNRTVSPSRGLSISGWKPSASDCYGPSAMRTSTSPR